MTTTEVASATLPSAPLPERRSGASALRSGRYLISLAHTSGLFYGGTLISDCPHAAGLAGGCAPAAALAGSRRPAGGDGLRRRLERSPPPGVRWREGLPLEFPSSLPSFPPAPGPQHPPRPPPP